MPERAVMQPLLVTISLLAYTLVLLIDGQTSGGQACHVRGCTEEHNTITCYESYSDNDTLPFRDSGITYDEVLIMQTNMIRIEQFFLANVSTKELFIRNNTIRTISAKAFWTGESNNETTHTELKELHITDNRIEYLTDGTFDPLINLEVLFLSRNRLRSLGSEIVINLSTLVNFGFSENELTALPVDWLPESLERLSFTGNRIGHLSRETFRGAPDLNSVALDPKEMTIEFDTFASFSKLNTVYLWQAGPCTCNYVWLLNTKDENAYTSCSYNKEKYASVKEYLLEECTKYIPAPEVTCPAFGTIGCDCRRHSIHCKQFYKGDDVPFFITSYKLYNWIIITNTNIKNIQAFVISGIRIKKLKLSRNRIETIDPKAFWSSATNAKSKLDKITYLNIAFNRLERITGGTFDHLIKLRYLHLNNNRLRTIDADLVVNMRYMKYLNVAYNKLSLVTTSLFPRSLHTLNVMRNPIGRLTNASFASPTRIVKLRISFKDVIIDANAFAGWKTLKVIEARPMGRCSCAYVWYLNTASNSKVCDLRKSEYSGDIRAYLNAEC